MDDSSRTEVRSFRSFLYTFFILTGVMSAPLAKGQEVTVLEGVQLVDGTEKEPLSNVTLVIRGDRIEAVGTAESITIPPGSQVIDCRGKTIIPGLISAHSHLGQYDGISRGLEHFTRQNILRQLKQYEAYGITTVVALGMNTPLLAELRRESNRAAFLGADFLGADRGIGAVMGAPGNVDLIDRPQTAEAGRQCVREAKARGTDFIKMWVDSRNAPAIPHDVFAAIIDEAHQLDLRVFAHVFTLADAKALVEADVDVIAHGIRDQPVDQEFINSMKSKNIWYIPTVALDEAFFIYADHPDWMNEPFFLHSVQPELLEQFNDPTWRQQTLASRSTRDARAAVEMNLRNLAILHDAGVLVAFGTDSGAFPIRIPGFAEHRELELIVSSGISPAAAIQIATGQTAKLLGLDNRGVIAPGKQADLIVLDGDPTQEISNVHRIHAIWHRGRKVSGPVTEFIP